jgi:hypothetical protein
MDTQSTLIAIFFITVIFFVVVLPAMRILIGLFRLAKRKYTWEEEIENDNFENLFRQNEDLDSESFKDTSHFLKHRNQRMLAITKKAIMSYGQQYHNWILSQTLKRFSVINNDESWDGYYKTLIDSRSGYDLIGFYEAYHIGMRYFKNDDFLIASDLLQQAYNTYPKQSINASEDEVRLLSMQKSGLCCILGYSLAQVDQIAKSKKFLVESTRLDPNYLTPLAILEYLEYGVISREYYVGINIIAGSNEDLAAVKVFMKYEQCSLGIKPNSTPDLEPTFGIFLRKVSISLTSLIGRLPIIFSKYTIIDFMGLVASLMLLTSIFHNTYDYKYFNFVRVIVFVTGIALFIQNLRKLDVTYSVLFFSIAVIYNPFQFSLVLLDRNYWIIIDVIAITIIQSLNVDRIKFQRYIDYFKKRDAT